MRLKIIFCAIFLIHLSCNDSPKVEWISSTDENRWQKEEKIIIKDKQPNVELDIQISDQKAQLIDGFGGCFNELGWDALMSLTEQERDKILKDLLSPDGVNLTYNRTPIGANDFARDWYSYNETADDFEMKNFNIDRDKTGLIPYIKAAQAINPQMKLWASPWSPPVWMKTTRHYATAAGDHNDFTKENEVEGDHFIQEPKYLDAYALYLSKYIDSYKENGIDISILQFQNEPYTKHQWPNCSWTPNAMANFIGKHLGPVFEKKHKDVELWFGTFNCNKMEDLATVVENAEASKYIRGIGLQWEGKDIVGEVHSKYPSLKLMQTESECGDGANNWNSAEYTWSLLNRYLGNGVNYYSYWNMVLDHTGKSTWGWKQNSLISINKETKEVVYNPEYYIMKHVSHYVKPGAYRLQTNENDNHLAFVNPDNTIILIVVNKEDSNKGIKIGVKNKIIEADVKAKSFNTFSISLK
ncbi:glycoside hydrolase family 30 beta sandwich domain-containing protein [Prevotella sp. 10(H)]|uniref:glycoside hydrolase family 30 protein n=1 Tax=Prevotella sp. 10(H) TaxID=1158294 RepID=UPI0004A75B61|nr:glycoside hydrolase family 30 protein [Prevotella sp. 10(H)]